MAAHLRQIAENQRLRRILDWTVFSLGIVSLSTAITATVLTN